MPGQNKYTKQKQIKSQRNRWKFLNTFFYNDRILDKILLLSEKKYYPLVRLNLGRYIDLQINLTVFN